jgi:hypothetical protein
MHIFKATFQDNENKNFKNPELFPDFSDFFSEKWQAFLSKTSDFRCSAKICSK